jgi:hypothetical protein
MAEMRCLTGTLILATAQLRGKLFACNFSGLLWDFGTICNVIRPQYEKWIQDPRVCRAAERSTVARKGQVFYSSDCLSLSYISFTCIELVV